MSKTPAVKPPVVPTLNVHAPIQGPVSHCISWTETETGFLASTFKVQNGAVVGEIRNLTPEGPKPRHHVADTLKVALVNGFINPVGGQ